MSPSEEKGMALGLKLFHIEPHKKSTMINGKLIVTRVYACFESPDAGKRRAVLNCYAKSRAGAWWHAIRWLKLLRKGKLR